jgi:hypothetical protein
MSFSVRVSIYLYQLRIKHTPLLCLTTAQSYLMTRSFYMFSLRLEQGARYNDIVVSKNLGNACDRQPYRNQHKESILACLEMHKE